MKCLSYASNCRAVLQVDWLCADGNWPLLAALCHAWDLASEALTFLALSIQGSFQVWLWGPGGFLWLLPRLCVLPGGCVGTMQPSNASCSGWHQSLRLSLLQGERDETPQDSVSGCVGVAFIRLTAPSGGSNFMAAVSRWGQLLFAYWGLAAGSWLGAEPPSAASPTHRCCADGSTQPLPWE